MKQRVWVCVLGASFLVLTAALGVELLLRIENRDELRRGYSLSPSYDRVTGLNRVRVAVIDNGFAGVGNGKYLPDTARLITCDDFNAETDIALDTTDRHGRLMAHAAWDITGGIEENAPEFLLLNGRGTKNTICALKWVAREANRVDVVLMSMNYESTGNFRGDGYINKWVTEAAIARPEMIFVVAAGNYKNAVSNDGISLGAVEAGTPARRPLRFTRNGTTRDYLEFTSRMSDDPSVAADRRPVLSIIVAWNQFSDEETVGTNKDLDVFLYDEHNNVLATTGGQLRQIRTGPAGDGETLQAREKVDFRLPLVQNRRYRIRIKAKGPATYDPEQDSVRVTIISNRPTRSDETTRQQVDAINFNDATPGREIMVPADNRRVITVGDFSPFASQGPTMDGRVKPEILMPLSAARLSDSTVSGDTSTAAALFAGMVAMMKAREPRLTREQILNWVNTRTIPAPRAITLEQARRYLPDAVGALDRSADPRNPERVRPFLMQNGQLLMVVNRFPRGLQPLFPTFGWARDVERIRDYEFYLVARRVQNAPTAPAQTVVRGYPRNSQENGPFPWDAYAENQNSFVAVITDEAYTVREQQQNSPERRKIWQMPTPDELRQEVRR